MGDLLELIHPLHGLCDDGDYWGTTVNNLLTKDLGIKPIQSDSALYHLDSYNVSILGVTNTYVYDSLHEKSEELQKHTEKTLKHFES